MIKKSLLLIIALAFFIRLINASYPPLLWDEASIGYNAYSILKTGKDEYGQTLPLVFKSFGDYKPGFYIYTTIPFIAVFGLTPLAVRFPSILAGSILPLFFYLLIIKLAPKSKYIGLISALLIAINPWNIHFSRGAWETNLLLLEIVIASYLFISQKKFLSALIFATTLYTYQGGKLLSPLMIIVLLCLNYKTLLSKRFHLNFTLPLILLSLPIIVGLISQNTGNRLQVFSLWSYQRPLSEIATLKLESNNLSFNLFYSQPLFFLRNFFVRYFNYFSPRFLAFEGDWQIGRNSSPYIGVLLYPTYFFFIFGLFASFISQIKKINIFFLLWLLIAPLPAALTIDIIQPVRSLAMSLPLIYFAAQGLNFSMIFIYQKHFFSKNIIFNISLGLVALSYLFSFIYYQDLYYLHMVKVHPDHWLYGYQQAVTYLLQHPNDEVYFSDFYGQPYIFYLFYSKYNPIAYQKQAKLMSGGLDVGRVEAIDNIIFQAPNFSALKQKKSQLMIFSYDDALRQGIDLNLLTPLSPINGHSTFYGYETF